jgi:HD-GYP domain-containing protein (c-di-GMP phosphodiesterase class II)
VKACVMYHSARMDGESVAAASPVQPRPAEDALHHDGNDRPGVLLVDASMLARVGELRNVPRHVVIVAADAHAQATLGRRAHISVADVPDGVARRRLLRAACQLSCARFSALRRRMAVQQREDELRELTRVGIGLMAERDRTELLHKIVEVGKRLTESDTGGLILAEHDEKLGQHLRLVLYESDSVPDLSGVAAQKFPIDETTIFGHAAVTKKLLVIDDAYNLPPDVGFHGENKFDEEYGYRRRSMLIVPMVDHVDRLVGVLIMINRKTDPAAKITDKEMADRYVVPYTSREVRLAHALASHAAVSIENAELYARIEHTLESFVKAAATAIDERDPTTAGHSVRVATLTIQIAKAVDHVDHGVFANVHFTRQQLRELYFAALLHDFGKIAVRDEVLLKAKKLPPVLWERIDARFELIYRTIELEYERKRAAASCEPTAETALAALDLARAEDLEQLERFRQIVAEANQPAVLARAPHAALVEMASLTFERADGTSAPYLTEDELHFLELPKGTLDASERAEVESHVEESYRFLASIPWTDDLKNLAGYAYAHHEKLDGSGYPRKLRAQDIPIQSRMMTIADMFDALTESDRPYKHAVSADVALNILRAEAKAGVLDSDLVELFAASKEYRKILDEDWRQF